MNAEAGSAGSAGHAELAGGRGGSYSGGGYSGGGISSNGGGPTLGMAGQAGSSGGGNAQGGTANHADDIAAASALSGFQLLDPCQSTYKAVATPGDVCPQDAAVKNQTTSLRFGGAPDVTYNVTLRVRGIMEGYWYTGGMLDGANFYRGGVPTIGGFSSACKNKTSELPFALPAEITPTDNCWNGFNMYALTVSAPKEHYYLNYTANKNGDRPPHAVYVSDYSVTIAIQGQAKLDFFIIGSDEHQCYNFNNVVNGASTKPSPYIGQFVQFGVLDVTRAH